MESLKLLSESLLKQINGEEESEIKFFITENTLSETL